MDDVEYVEAEDFEALEALLHSAERRLNHTVGSKRRASASPRRPGHAVASAHSAQAGRTSLFIQPAALQAAPGQQPGAAAPPSVLEQLVCPPAAVARQTADNGQQQQQQHKHREWVLAVSGALLPGSSGGPESRSSSHAAAPASSCCGNTHVGVAANSDLRAPFGHKAGAQQPQHPSSTTGSNARHAGSSRSSVAAAAGVTAVQHTVPSNPSARQQGVSLGTQQWGAAGNSSAVGNGAHQISSSGVSFGSGGCSRRHTGSVPGPADAAAMQRSNSWSVGQQQKQTQQQEVQQAQALGQQQWHHAEQQQKQKHAWQQQQHTGSSRHQQWQQRGQHSVQQQAPPHVQQQQQPVRPPATILPQAQHQQQHLQEHRQQQQQQLGQAGQMHAVAAPSLAAGDTTLQARVPPAVVGSEGSSSGLSGSGAGAAVSGSGAGAGRRRLPSSLSAKSSRGPGSGGSGNGSGGAHRSSSDPIPHSHHYQQQQQQQPGRPHGPRLLPWAGRVQYAATAADVDALCRQMLAAGPPGVVGFDVEWKPSFTKGAPPNKAALIQLAYSCKRGKDCRLQVWDEGQAVTVLLLHIKYSGITRKLQEILLDDQIVKLGVNIGGDVLKLGSDYGVQVFGALDLSDAAHGHQLRAVEGVTANVQPKKWSLAGLIEEVCGLELPKPKHIRLGNWERHPLTREQQRYAAMDAYACLLLHWELQQLPTKETLQQQLLGAMRERAAQAACEEEEEREVT